MVNASAKNVVTKAAPRASVMRTTVTWVGHDDDLRGLSRSQPSNVAHRAPARAAPLPPLSDRARPRDGEGKRIFDRRRIGH
jgi:hypothetical protein